MSLAGTGGARRRPGFEGAFRSGRKPREVAIVALGQWRRVADGLARAEAKADHGLDQLHRSYHSVDRRQPELGDIVGTRDPAVNPG